METLKLVCLLLLWHIHENNGQFATQCAIDGTTGCGCTNAAAANIQKRILNGGAQVTGRTWGWVLSLRQNNVHQCSATLIHAEYAVTSASCVQPLISQISVLSIQAGSNNLAVPVVAPVVLQSITSIFIHPTYNPTTLADNIALIRFAPLTLNNANGVGTICLPAVNEAVVENDQHAIVGWGAIVAGGAEQVDGLRQAQQLTSLSQGAAAAQVACAGVVGGASENRFCARQTAAANGRVACAQDEGGPLMRVEGAAPNQKWFLRGIQSRVAAACPDATTWRPYTRVSSYRTYIDSVLAGQVNPTATVLTTTTNPTTRATTAAGGSSSTTTTTSTTTSTTRRSAAVGHYPTFLHFAYSFLILPFIFFSLH